VRKGVVGATLNPANVAAATTTTLSPLSAVTYGTAVSFTATVSPTPTNGVTVEFYDGATLIGSGTTSGGTASYTTTATQLSAVASPHSITAKFLGNASFATSTSSALSQVVNQKSLTVSGITASDKTYDGLTTASLNTGSAALVGNLDGGNVALSTGSASGTFTPNANAGVGKTVQIAGLSISGSASGNYTLTQPTATATIDPAPLDITAGNDSKSYDGLAYSGGNGVSYSGFVNSETPAVLGGTLSFGGTSQGAIDAGGYSIIPSGLTSGNYDITFNNGTLTIGTTPLSITADNDSKTYDGLAYSGGNGVTYSGFVNSETPAVLSGTLSFGGTSQGATDVGGYSIIPSGLTSSNYDITFNNGTLTIGTTPLSITADDDSKTYDGLAYSGGNGVSYSGFVNSETPAVLSGTLSFGGTSQGATDVGGYSIIPSGLTSGNYDITFNNGTLTVGAAPLDVTANNDSKTYDKTAYSGGNGVSYSGFVNSETPAVLGGTLSFGGTSQGAINAGSYSIVPGGLTSGNYDITFNNGTLTIDPVDITITAQHDERVYDGTNASPVAPQITSGALASGDTASLNQTFDDKNVGTGKTLSAAGSTISDGNGGNNYAVTFVDDSSGVITQYDLEVTAVSDSREYDGTTDSTGMPTITLGDLQGTDSATWTQTFDNENAGTNKTLTPAGSVSDGNGGANYNVVFNSVSNGSITQRAITVTAATDSKEYDGTNSSSATPTVTAGSLASGDSEAFTQTFDDEKAGTGKTLTPAGSVNDGNSGGNYVVTFVEDTTGEITVRSIEVTAASDSKVYDGTDSSTGVPSITNGSLAAGDSVNWIQAFDDQNAGNNKTITPTGSIDDNNGGANYSVTFVTALGDITPADLTVTANDKTIHFDNPTPTFDFAVSGFIAPDGFSTDPVCAVAGSPTAVGDYPIVCSGGDAGTNYNILYVDGTYTITNKEVLDVTASSANITYGDLDPAITPSYNGFTGGDDATDLNVAPSCSASGPFTVVGSPFTSSCSGGSDDKYDFNFINGSVTVDPKGLTITADNADKTYGDVASFTGIEFSANGLINSDSVSGVTLNSTGAPVTAAVGSYDIVPSAATGTGLGNYSITYANGTLTIDPKALTITADNASKSYGATLTFAGTEFSAPGLVNSDVVNSVTLTSTGAVNTANVGSYSIVASAAVGTGLGNYTISYANGSLSVNKAGLIVTAVSQTKAFGGNDPVFTFSLTGLQNGETAGVLDTAPTCGVSVAHGAPGAYPIVCSGGADANYSFTSYVDGTLTVSGVNSATFADVPMSYWAWKYVESLYAFGITGGCGSSPLIYCPITSVTRDQMAVFLLKSRYGKAYNPPPVGSSTGFNDVPTNYWAAAWIKQLAAEGITGGCGNGNYCPKTVVTRDQMAVFLLRAKYGNTYAPPAVVGGTGFNDVPDNYWAAAWIKQLAAEGVTGGCGGGNYCPGTAVSRDQMAVFLVATFSLPTP
jgi:hypothetical protein